MRWKPALFYAFYALIFVAVFMGFTRPQKPAVAKPAAAPSAAEINVPVSDGRWEQLKASLPQWLREKSQPDNRAAVEALDHGFFDPVDRVLTRVETEAWIKDLETAKIVFENNGVKIGKWTYHPQTQWLSIVLPSGLRTIVSGYVFEDVSYADGKWSYSNGGVRVLMEGRPSRSTRNSPVSR